MSRRFSLAEAQRLIPHVERLMRDALERKGEYEQAERAIQSFTERVMMMGGMNVDRDRAREARQRRDTAVQNLREAIERLQQLGCVVKDLDIGLVDFPTRFRGEDVYLCWRMGEKAIEFWHGMDEGFRGRKAIDRDFREHHEGEPEQ
ncbi:MAG: DUF2203 domain-containing protein [Bryobacteraceae bacterium]